MEFKTGDAEPAPETPAITTGSAVGPFSTPEETGCKVPVFRQGLNLKTGYGYYRCGLCDNCCPVGDPKHIIGEQKKPARGGDVTFIVKTALSVEAGRGYKAPGGDIIFKTDDTERMRITHDGRFIVGGEEVTGVEAVRDGFLEWFASTGYFDRNPPARE